MGYEDVRRHLDLVRAFFEARSAIDIAESHHEPGGVRRAFMIRTLAEYIGAYLRDDVLVVMFKFDDNSVDPLLIDFVYEVVRKRMKKIIVSNFPGLTADDIAIHVTDTSGNLGDFEF